MSNNGQVVQLKDLYGLSVGLILPPCSETQLISKQLERIGCTPAVIWPIPKTLPDNIGAVILTVEPEYRSQVRQLAISITEMSPPIIVIVEFEDPSTLQLVLEIGAEAVLERPIKPFGLLTNLMLSRSNWQKRTHSYHIIQKLEEKKSEETTVLIAQYILETRYKVAKNNTYRVLQKLAMNNRMSIKTLSKKILLDEWDGPSLFP